MSKAKINTITLTEKGFLPRKWMEDNLGAGPGDYLTQINIPGTKAVVLMKLDPVYGVPERIRALAEPEPTVPALVVTEGPSDAEKEKQD
ncbi:MAG: hypothetical protein KKB70_06335 [Proteobacteria bacterium]|nr:hypothetical protein [Pseudomonadota bacterium]